jgi:hypothetical protein
VSTCPPSLLDTGHNFVLNAEGPRQPIDVRGDDHVGVASFNGLHGSPQPGAVAERRAAHVEFFDDLQQLEMVALARHPDAVALLNGRRESVSIPAVDLGCANDAEGSAGGGGWPRKSESETSLPSWSGSVKSGAVARSWIMRSRMAGAARAAT